jgi:hypothetical protein
VNRAPFTHWEDAVIIRAWQVCFEILLTPAHHPSIASEILPQGSLITVVSFASPILAEASASCTR